MTDINQKEFGTILRLFRKGSHITQVEVATKVGVRQATLSAWELGHQVPIKKHLEKLILELKLDDSGAHQLRAAHTSAETIDKSYTTKPISVINEAQSVAKQLFGSGGYDLWIVGPTALPMVNEMDVRNLWVENLSQGVDYNVVWFIDEVTAEAFMNPLATAMNDVQHRSIEAFTELAGNDPDPTAKLGKIKQFPLVFNQVGDSQYAWDTFRRFEHSLAIGRTNQLASTSDGDLLTEYLREFQSEEGTAASGDQQQKTLKEIIAAIGAYWLRGAGLACYMPHGSGDPLVNISLPKLRLTRTDIAQRPNTLYWLSEEDERVLGKVIRRLSILMNKIEQQALINPQTPDRKELPK